ncbi:MAG: hypothetical protein PHO26_05175 [Dehalococcoidia bacterium]|jgi:DNA anti-recombination protein RmuC|nr:hypothetical protein [Dehalococcoidia bacterium]MDD5494040.1 hypothetical protein [Dehalococcoidia bacterium]
MGSTGQAKQTRHKGPERSDRESVGQSSTQVDLGKVAATGAHDGVDQVREILFGAQREEYDRRFSRLEELLVKNLSNLNNEMTEKVGALRDEHDKRLARLEELLAKNIADLSNDTAKKINALKDDYTSKFAHIEELLKKIDGEIQEIRKEKADKSAVSKLVEAIVKLSHDQTAGW